MGGGAGNLGLDAAPRDVGALDRGELDTATADDVAESGFGAPDAAWADEVAESEAGAPDAVRWRLVWADEFDTDGRWDETKWNIEIHPPGWVNDELQNYVDRAENARVENGNLVIEAREDFFGNQEYSSARLNSAYKGDLLYGRVEVRAKLPKGTGTWPAIWLLATDENYGPWPNSGEIDIMEHVGWDPGIVHATTHCYNFRAAKGTLMTGWTIVPTFGDDMHVYALEWSADLIDVLVDGNKFFTFANDGTGWQSWPFDRRFNIILNLAIGGSWGGVKGVDNSIFPVRMEVDYVRLYERSL
jgi:beta-glucanase (GH16 family)